MAEIQRIDINSKLSDYASFNANDSSNNRDPGMTNVNDASGFNNISRTNEIKKNITDPRNIKRILFYFSKFDDGQSDVVANAINQDEKISKRVTYKSLDEDIIEGNYPNPEIINGTPTILVTTIDNDNISIRGISKCLEWLNEKTQTVGHNQGNNAVVGSNMGSVGLHESHKDFTKGANINKENAESFIRDQRFSSAPGSKGSGGGEADFQKKMDELTKQRNLDIPMPQKPQ